jgi:hypothetical protein
MMIAGLNASISIFRRGSFKISREYSFARFKVYFTRLLVPFSLIWIIEVLILIASGEATSKKIFFSYLYGGMGPGSYFTPLFLQHLIFFPIVLWIKERLNLFLGDYYTIAFFFGLSVFAEYLCIFFNCPNWIYRMLYVRYLFFAVVGSYLFVNSFSKKFVYVFIVLGFIYIYISSYLKFNFPCIYPSWGFQHAPAAFYTTFLIFSLCKIYSFIDILKKILIVCGKASYHIFLIQMFWFWIFSNRILDLLRSYFCDINIVAILYIGISILVCISCGYLFYHFERTGSKYVFTKLGFN